MKRYAKAIVPALWLAGCFAPGARIGSGPGTEYSLVEAISRENKSVHVSVSPRVELMSVLQAISRYPSVYGFLMNDADFEYRREVLEWFGTFKTHPAVLLFDHVSAGPGKLNFNAPSAIMLYVNEHLEMRDDIRFDDFVLSRAGGIDSLRLFMMLMKDFADQSRFNEFYLRHAEYYRKLIAGTIGELGSRNYVGELENFYGTKQQSYSIILVSLYSHVGFGNSVVQKTGERDIFAVLGARSVREDTPFFGDREYLSYMVRHEFSHPFVNPLTEKYWADIKDYASEYDSIPAVAKHNVCGDWQECINEFTIRAITVQMAYREEKEIGFEMYTKEKSRGVYNLNKLLVRIQRFLNDRETYPTFESFYPNILDVFKQGGD